MKKHVVALLVLAALVLVLVGCDNEVGTGTMSFTGRYVAGAESGALWREGEGTYDLVFLRDRTEGETLSAYATGDVIRIVCPAVPFSQEEGRWWIDVLESSRVSRGGVGDIPAEVYERIP